MTHLIDSSVLVRHFRGDATVWRRLAELVTAHSLALCEPVAMEVLSGASGRTAPRIEQFVDSLPSLSVDPDLDFRSAALVMRRVRASGHTIRSSIDALIAAVALRHDAVVVHDDVDFVRIAAVSPLLHDRWSA